MHKLVGPVLLSQVGAAHSPAPGYSRTLRRLSRSIDKEACLYLSECSNLILKKASFFKVIMLRATLLLATLSTSPALWCGAGGPCFRAGRASVCHSALAASVCHSHGRRTRRTTRTTPSCSGRGVEEVGKDRCTMDEAAPRTLDEARTMTGWREGDRFLFGYGALLASEVWRRRGIDESLGGRRRALRAVAKGRGMSPCRGQRGRR